MPKVGNLFKLISLLCVSIVFSIEFAEYQVPFFWQVVFQFTLGILWARTFPLQFKPEAKDDK